MRERKKNTKINLFFMFDFIIKDIKSNQILSSFLIILYIFNFF